MNTLLDVLKNIGTRASRISVAAVVLAASTFGPIAASQTVSAAPGDTLDVTSVCIGQIAFLNVVGNNNTAGDLTVTYSYLTFSSGPWTVPANTLDTRSFDTNETILPTGTVTAVVDGVGTFTANYAAINCDTTVQTPTLLSPADGVYRKTSNSGANVSSWSTVSDISQPVTYEYQSASDIGFTNSLYGPSSALVTVNGGTAQIVNDGEPEGTYYWRVRAVDSRGNNSEWSSVRSINIDNTAPVAPVISSPTDGLIVKSSNIQKVDWNDVTDPSGPGVQYDYQVSTDPALAFDGSFASPLATIRGSISEQATPGTPEGTYYIHVRAIDALGNVGPWSTVVSVTVDDTPPVLTVDTLAPTTDRTPFITGTTTDKNSPVAVSVSGAGSPISLGNATIDSILNLMGTYNWSVLSSLIDAGMYSVDVTSTDIAGNTGTSTGSITVQKTDITITAHPKSKVYGDANPTFTYTVSPLPLPYGEADTVIGIIACTNIPEDSNFGSYTITCSAPGNNNYNVVAVPATFTISKAPVTVTADNLSRLYGDANPTGTFVATGLKFSQAQSILGPVSCTSPATPTSSVAGSPYVVNCLGATNGNYDVTYVAGTLTVNPAPVTVTANNRTKTYSSNNPSLTFSSVGRKNGELQTVLGVTCTTTAVKASPAGTYPITCGGSTNTNYAVTYVAGTLTINKANLIVVGPFASRTYGNPNPALNPTYFGFVNGDNAGSLTTAPTCTTNATSTSPVVGYYPTVCSGGISSNYSFTYISGALVITPASAVITADDATKVYGEANPTYTYSAAGLKNGEDKSVLGTITCSSMTDETSVVGDYDITCALASGRNFNYSYTFAKGTLSITPAVLTVLANNQTRTYGGTNPVLGFIYAGFVNSDDATSLTTEPTCTTMASAVSNTGSYVITCDNGVADNYSFTYVDGTLTVAKALVTITANNQTRLVGDANPALTTTATGFVNGETTSVFTTAAVCTTTATEASANGSYPITCNGAAASNYDFAYNSGTMTVVTPRPVVAVAAVNRTQAPEEVAPIADNTVLAASNQVGTVTTPDDASLSEVKSDNDQTKNNEKSDDNQFLGLGWWWIPLVLLLLGGGYYYAMKRAEQE